MEEYGGVWGSYGGNIEGAVRNMRNMLDSGEVGAVCGGGMVGDGSCSCDNTHRDGGRRK